MGSLFGDRGFLQLVRQQQRAEVLAREIEDLRLENRRLASEIAALRSDPRAIERLAREELGLSRPGETVFLIREEPPAPTPAAARARRRRARNRLTLDGEGM